MQAIRLQQITRGERKDAMPERTIEAAVPEILHFHPEWFTDPPPWWIWKNIEERFDKAKLADFVKAQFEAKTSILTAQKAALQAQIHALDAQIKVNDLGAKMLSAKAGRGAPAVSY